MTCDASFEKTKYALEAQLSILIDKLAYHARLRQQCKRKITALQKKLRQLDKKSQTTKGDY